MPIALNPAERLPLPKWQRPAKTTHELPWAEIKVLDLSTFDVPGGKQKLAEELRDAVSVLIIFHCEPVQDVSADKTGRYTQPASSVWSARV